MKVIIACSKNWFIRNLEKKHLKKFYFIKKKNQLNFKFLQKYKPKYIFFPHWSFKISKKIYNNFTCICFHTAPLPYGRGGSPIQNLIKRGINSSPVNAIKVENKIDSGDIIIKKKIKLNGSLDEIFRRLSLIIFDMIKNIINKKKLVFKKQRGNIYYFKRLDKNDSNILKHNFYSLKKIYNHIRMLDHDDYPRAFIPLKKHNILFKNALYQKGVLTSQVEFKKK